MSKVPVQLHGGFHDGLIGVVAAEHPDEAPEIIEVEEVPLTSGHHQVLGPNLDPLKEKPVVRYRRSEQECTYLTYRLERPASTKS